MIVDTAGRLHNKSDLMDQLKKIIRVIKKIDESFPNQITLVLDGNIGQNSIRQAEVFKQICEIDSLIITKLDGTAKGGVIVPIAELLKIPILAVGTGEKKEDLILHLNYLRVSKSMKKAEEYASRIIRDLMIQDRLDFKDLS